MAIHSLIACRRDLDQPLTVTPLRHALVSGDDRGDRFEVTVSRAGQPVTLDGASVMGYFVRSADGCTIPVTGGASGSAAWVLLPEACYALPGRFTLTLKASAGAERHALCVWEGAVLRSATDAVVDPGHVIPSLQELLAMIEQMESVTSAAQKATAEANAAKSNADSAASKANTATQQANSARDAAHAAAESAAKWENVTVRVTMLGADQSPSATVTDTQTGKSLSFQLPRGLTGLTPKLTVGKVTTGEPGSSVIATITGAAETPLLNLTIPQGMTGSVDSLTVNGRRVVNGRLDLTPADVGALPAKGTAADSSLLGGKPPTAYGSPRNLLDNSCFLPGRVVNQQSVTSVSTAVGVLLDRWNTYRADAAQPFLLQVADDGLRLTNMYCQQRFEKGLLRQGTAYTFAMATDKGLYVNAGPAAPVTIGYYESGFDFLSVHLEQIVPDGTAIYWMALYEGEYTLDTLPDYVCKGFAAELAECQRYYNNYGLNYTFRSSGKDAGRIVVTYPKMRIAPTAKLIGTEGIRSSYVRADSAVIETGAAAEGTCYVTSIILNATL